MIVPQYKPLKLPSQAYQLVCPKCGYRSNAYLDTLSRMGIELLKKMSGYKNKCPVCDSELKKEKVLIIS